MDDESINKKSLIGALITEPLDQLSIAELKDRIKTTIRDQSM